MIKQYIRQALQMIKENRLVSAISIIGTAISIAMIMIVVLVIQIQVVNYYPENNRDRMLFVEGGTQASAKDNSRTGRGNMSVETAQACFYSLKDVECVTAYSGADMAFSLPNQPMFKAFHVKEVDYNFWQVFSFRFSQGKAFSKADFDSGLKQVVITESVARRFFGMDNAIGKELLLNRVAYRVCGVVKDVSKAASTAYADAWIPYSTDTGIMRINPNEENIMGALNVIILAHSAADFETVRGDIEKLRVAYNNTKRDYEVSFFHNPITQWDKARGSGGQNYVSLKEYWLETGGVLLFLLLVPALNLLGVTQSSVQKRQAEIGVRKAFGATNRTIISQVLCENGVTTLIGGGIGLILSLIALPLCKDFMLSNSDTALNMDMLFKPMLFVIALLFCLALNLLSAGLPAWLIANKSICNALKNEEETNK